ncbi:hypothetical protein AOQ84DRAFT_355578 [Glonium stellatum]|uniref:Uncharacterized protein n=1 Tax=Glonium stellatum TaxID=574774 RepID=A0A8E2EWM0_9PEZI|nr:hypothetical protein AOQ84DRAFT_355578 [Glonium stellatum]
MPTRSWRYAPVSSVLFALFARLRFRTFFCAAYRCCSGTNDPAWLMRSLSPCTMLTIRISCRKTQAAFPPSRQIDVAFSPGRAGFLGPNSSSSCLPGTGPFPNIVFLPLNISSLQLEQCLVLPIDIVLEPADQGEE